jgi:hypothetical protein
MISAVKATGMREPTMETAAVETTAMETTAMETTARMAAPAAAMRGERATGGAKHGRKQYRCGGFSKPPSCRHLFLCSVHLVHN